MDSRQPQASCSLGTGTAVLGPCLPWKCQENDVATVLPTTGQAGTPDQHPRCWPWSMRQALPSCARSMGVLL